MKRMRDKTICLVMIVRDESEVIRRCLDSVAPFIDHYVIVDTGSSDGTPDIIRTHMEDLKRPGKVYYSQWKDYGTNRTESLELSVGICDYRMIIDADDYLEVDEPSVFDSLSADAYRFAIKLDKLVYHRIQLVKSNQEWRYVGVLHEFIRYTGTSPIIDEELPGVSMIAGVSGHKRSIKGKDKYHNDALIFEKELITNPSLEEGLKERYWFYCAQSYRDAGMCDRAIKAYQKRIELGGWTEEIYISLLNIARLKASLKSPIEEVERAFSIAWEYRPIRLEAGYELMKILLYQQRFFMAFTIGNMCLKMGACSDVLFVEHAIWKWKFLDDYSVACYRTGNLEEAVNSATNIIESNAYNEAPEADKERIKKNLESYKKDWELLKLKTNGTKEV